jgi:sugar phosphate isomerase/epimerase
MADRTLEACEKNRVSIISSFGGHNGHQHYLGHPDKECRKEAERFFRQAIRQTAYIGAKSYGTCFAIQTVRTNSDDRLRRQVLEEALEAYRRLADYGAEMGLKAIAYEMTSVPREMCATFAENDYVLEVGAGFAIPLRICLDIGHRFAEGGPEADHLAWIRRYGSKCDVIDCHQTDREASRHWPFSDEANRKGIIRGPEVTSAIMESLAGDILLAFEIRTPAFFPHEDCHLNGLIESVRYWRQWIAD